MALGNNCSENDYEGLHNKQCLVLGGSGFIGRNLCLFLREQAALVRSFSCHADSIEGVHCVTGDFLNIRDVRRALEGIDIVFHLISTTLPASSNSRIEADASENILASIRLFDACRDGGIERIIFASSGGTIYGDATQIPTPEDYPPSPICAYGVSKLAIEKYLGLYERLHGMRTVSLRISNPFGPYQVGAKSQGVIGTCITKILNQDRFEIWGDGLVVRDYLYIDDAVLAFAVAANYKGSHGVFNIGSGIGHSLNSVIELVRKKLGIPFEPVYLPQRKVDVPISILDCQLAKRELGWHPNMELAEGIERTIQWFKSNSR